jgi:hypothetical protein
MDRLRSRLKNRGLHAPAHDLLLLLWVRNQATERKWKGFDGPQAKIAPHPPL